MEDILNEIISLEHEIENSNKDKLGRFNFGFFNENDKLKFVTPFLSIKLQDEGKLNIRYPEGKKACVVLTHDIDLPVHSLLNLIKLLFKDFKKKYYKNAYYRILGFFNKQKDLWRNFNYIMDLEEKYSAKSSFYFMSTRDTHKLYNIEKFENDIKNISNRGFEIGLHGGYDNSWKDLNILMEEKQRLEKCLGKKIIGIRQHYLRYDHNKTLVNDKKAGFLYDTTLGYNDYIGFRNGMGHIFNPIDLNTGKLIKGFYEIPLVIMDCTLWNYMKLDFNEAWQEVKSILDKVISIGGTVSILWHNDQFDDTFHPRSGELYEKILIYLKNNNVWMTSGEECLKYLKETNQI